jgi:hypothetical protein
LKFEVKTQAPEGAFFVGCEERYLGIKEKTSIQDLVSHSGRSESEDPESRVK